MTAADADFIIEHFDADPAPFLQAFVERRLSAIVRPAGATAMTELASATALVIVAGPRQLGLVRERVQAAWKEVFNFGCSSVVAVPPTELSIYGSLPQSGAMPLSKVGGMTDARSDLVIADPATVANHASTLRRGRAPKETLKIDPPGVLNLVDSGEVLVKRAFNKEDRVELSVLTGGRTATVFRVDAFGPGTSRPLPFVAKIAERRRIAEEFDNFCDNVSDFVPFPFRPDLVRERCILGAERGILVSHFIEHSEPLYRPILRGVSPKVLHSVFDDLLRGWWRLGAADAPTGGNSVTTGLDSWYDPPSDRKDRQDALSLHYGLARGRVASVWKPEVFQEKFKGLPAVPHVRGSIHGDLHSRNIHLRDDELVLIDFGTVKDGPVLADPATLEASLVLEAGMACKTPEPRRAWEEFVSKHLYAPGWNRRMPSPRPPDELSEALQSLWQAVRIIRIHVAAMQAAGHEYAWLVAAAFFRQATYHHDDLPEEEATVAHLYAVASEFAASL